MTITFDGTRVNDSDSSTGWSNLGGGGPAPASEAQLRYQYSGSGSVGAVNRKVATTASRTGIQYDPAAGAIDMTAATHPLWFAKGYIADFGDLNATYGVEYRLGSASGAYYDYNVAGTGANRAVFNAYPAQGGYHIVAINPNIAAWREGTTGTPALSAVDYFGMAAQFIVGGAKSENLALDAIDLGRGLIFTGSSGTFGDYLTADQNTIANRWGVVNGTDTAFNARGLLTIGDSGGTLTTFSDSTRIITFVDGYHGPGDVGVYVYLTNASNSVTIGNTLIGLGSSTTSDTRPDFTVSGTSGSCSITGTLTNFRNVALTSATSVNSSIIEASDITQSSAHIQNSIIQTDAASGVAVINDATFGTASGIHDVEFEQVGAGHAIEITSPGSYTFTNISFTGYGGTPGSNLTPSSGANDAAIYNSSGGSVTINVVGGDAPSIRNAASSDTTVVASSTYYVSNVIAGSEVRIIDESSPVTILAGVENIGVSPEGLSNVTTEADPDNPGRYRVAYSYNQADAPITATIRVINLNYVIVEQGVTIPTGGGSLLVSQRPDRNYSNP